MWKKVNPWTKLFLRWGRGRDVMRLREEYYRTPFDAIDFYLLLPNTPDATVAITKWWNHEWAKMGQKEIMNTFNGNPSSTFGPSNVTSSPRSWQCEQAILGISTLFWPSHLKTIKTFWIAHDRCMIFVRLSRIQGPTIFIELIQTKIEIAFTAQREKTLNRSTVDIGYYDYLGTMAK